MKHNEEKTKSKLSVSCTIFLIYNRGGNGIM